jgi:hypothetical protein
MRSSVDLVTALSKAFCAKCPDHYPTANDVFLVGPAPHGQLIPAAIAQHANPHLFEFAAQLVERAAVQALLCLGEDDEAVDAAQVCGDPARCNCFSCKGA